MEYPYFKGLEADRYSFYRVPKALVKADLFQKMSGDAKLLYAVLLDRMSLSIKNGWHDKHGNAYTGMKPRRRNRTSLRCWSSSTPAKPARMMKPSKMP